MVVEELVVGAAVEEVGVNSAPVLSNSGEEGEHEAANNESATKHDGTKRFTPIYRQVTSLTEPFGLLPPHFYERPPPHIYEMCVRDSLP